MLDLKRTSLSALFVLVALAGCSPDDYPTGPRFEAEPPPGPELVTFTYVVPEGAPEITSINLAGTLNDWNTTATPMTDNGDGTWSVAVELEPGTYEYKYVFNDVYVGNMCDDATWGDPDNNGMVDLEAEECLSGGNAIRTVGGGEEPEPEPETVPTTFTYVVPADAPAITSMNLAGEMNEWDPAATAMTDNGDGTWSVTLDLVPGDYQYKYVFNGEWAGNMCGEATWGHPDNENWVDLEASGCEGENAVRTVGAAEEPELIATTFTYEVPADAPAITSINLAGEMNEWDPAATAMSDNGDGTWSVTLDLAPGDYQYKYVFNGEWAGNMCGEATWGHPDSDDWVDLEASGCEGENAVRTVGAAEEPELVATTFTYEVPADAPAITSINLAGEMNEWDPAATAMSDNGDGTWSVTLDLAPGDYQYKYVFNGEWAGNMCGESTWGHPDTDNWVDLEASGCEGENAVRTVGEAGGGEEPTTDHTFTYIVPSTAPAITSINLAGDMNGWDASATPFGDNGDGTWSVNVDLEPGTYLYKFVFNGGTWPENMCNDADWGHPDHEMKVDPDVTSCVDDNNGGFNGVLIIE